LIDKVSRQFKTLMKIFEQRHQNFHSGNSIFGLVQYIGQEHHFRIGATLIPNYNGLFNLRYV